MALRWVERLLNDFEPITAWAARRRGLTSISVSHQAAFAYDVPREGESLSDRLIMRAFAPTDIQLGVHWYHFDQPIVPPFIIDKPAILLCLPCCPARLHCC